MHKHAQCSVFLDLAIHWKGLIDPYLSEEETQSQRGLPATPRRELSDSPLAMRPSSQDRRVDRRLSSLKETAQGVPQGRERAAQKCWPLVPPRLTAPARSK